MLAFRLRALFLPNFKSPRLGMTIAELLNGLLDYADAEGNRAASTTSVANCDGSSGRVHGFVLVKKRSSIDATRRSAWPLRLAFIDSAPKRVVQSRGVQIDWGGAFIFRWTLDQPKVRLARARGMHVFTGEDLDFI